MIYLLCFLSLSEMMKEKTEQILMKYYIRKNSYHKVFKSKMNMIFGTEINDFILCGGSIQDVFSSQRGREGI